MSLGALNDLLGLALKSFEVVSLFFDSSNEKIEGGSTSGDDISTPGGLCTTVIGVMDQHFMAIKGIQTE